MNRQEIVDALTALVFAPKAEVYAAAARVAERLGLPDGWLNDGVKGFLAGPDPWPGEILDLPGLRVQAASAEMPLALKCMAHRLGEDDDDVLFLAAHLGLTTAEAVLDLVTEVFGDRVDVRTELYVRSVLGD